MLCDFVPLVNVNSLFDIQELSTKLSLLFLPLVLESLIVSNSGINELIGHLKGF